MNKLELKFIDNSKTREAEKIKNILHNLDMTHPDYNSVMDDVTEKFIILVEGLKLEPYEDINDKNTIGYGFNMDDGGAREFFNRVLGKKLDQNGEKFVFDKVLKREQKITKEAAKLLLKEALSVRLKEIKNIYKEIWDKLRPNEQLAIISLYYNSPVLVNATTAFYKHIKNYMNEDGNPYHLFLAVKEVKERSNPNKHDGMQNRRNAEAELLNSTSCANYIPANSPSDIYSKMNILIGKTRVPRNLDSIHGVNENSEYFIWRTQLDEKVRKEHLAKEGIVFRKDNVKNMPETEFKDYNCRCWAEHIPNNLFIIEPEQGFKSFREFAKHNSQSQIIINSHSIKTVFSNSNLT